MKTVNLSILLIAMLLGTGCMQSRYITEQYIKTKIETHTPGTNSSIRTYTIYKSEATSSTTHYLELTGYKYNGAKGLVIGADRYYNQRAKLTGLPLTLAEITYIVLDEAQCKALLDNEPKIWNQLLKSERPQMNEAAYVDYTVSDELFISYKRYTTDINASTLNLWVDGEKYSVPAKKITKKLRKFMTY